MAENQPPLPPYLSMNREGTLEVDIPRMLREFGLADTDWNREIAVKVVQEVIEELYPEAKQFVTRNN